MSSLEEIWKCIEKLKEDLEKIGCDVTVTVAVDLEGPPEGSYAELAARLRKAFEEDREGG